jgi:hypothetical protein
MSPAVAWRYIVPSMSRARVNRHLQVFRASNIAQPRVGQREACIRLGDSVVVWHSSSSDAVSFFALSLLEATLSTAHANLVKFTLVHHSAILESNHRRRHRRLHQSLVYGWCGPSSRCLVPDLPGVISLDFVNNG